MKRISAFFALFLLCYAIYFDLSKGTLTLVNADHKQIKKETASEQEIEYFTMRVYSGDTLISIVEANLNAPLPVSIEKVIDDFKNLNDGLHPKEMQIGQTYKFPVYQSGRENQ